MQSGLLRSALVLLLPACTTPPDTRETPAAPPPADALERRADAVRAPADDAYPEEADPDALFHGLVPRPVPIAGTIGATALRRRRQEAGYSELLTPQLLSIENIWLYYRAHPRDTTWLELTLPVGNQLEPALPELTARRANLDGRGRAEVLLRWRNAGYGSGGGMYWVSHYLLDLAPPRPRLLLSAATAEVNEAFPGYAAMHGDTLRPDEILNGYERSIELRGREVLVGAVDTLGPPLEYMMQPLTPLPAGRYRYQGGRLRRVGR